MTIKPNIFDYATSELSQDAFLCYLLEFGKIEYKNTKEYECAKNFLKKCEIVEDVKKIHTQYKHIDVLVETENYLLIIEDKTYTEEHDDQILHYVKSLQEDDDLNNKTNPKKIVACYLKTDDYLRKYQPDPKKIQDLRIEKYDYCSLKRDDVKDIIKESKNFIFQSFYYHLEKFDRNCDDNDISTWDKSKWFKYLKSLFEQYNVYKEDSKTYGYCAINNYVPNASGGFYATHFDWQDLPEEMQKYFDDKQTKAGTYKQLELYFSDNKTSLIKLTYRFHSNNWSKEETKKYRDKGCLRKLQDKINESGYRNQNRIGASTAFKVISFGDDKKSESKINKETSKKIFEIIETFVKNPS